MIEEIQTELDFVPDVIFCSVGGGGLLGGIIHGCAAGWGHGGSRNCGCVCVTPDLITRTVPIVAIEPPLPQVISMEQVCMRDNDSSPGPTEHPAAPLIQADPSILSPNRRVPDPEYPTRPS